jgi:hypothetical protein
MALVGIEFCETPGTVASASQPYDPRFFRTERRGLGGERRQYLLLVFGKQIDEARGIKAMVRIYQVFDSLRD